MTWLLSGHAVAETIQSYAAIHVHDITFHDEINDQGQPCPPMTVYYEREGGA